jgi:hypothetical protein
MQGITWRPVITGKPAAKKVPATIEMPETKVSVANIERSGTAGMLATAGLPAKAVASKSLDAINNDRGP